MPPFQPPIARSFALLTAATILACTPEGDSCARTTDDIVMKAIAVDDALRIRVEVEFRGGDPNAEDAALELCETDKLAIAGEPAKVIAKSDRFVYSRTFAATDEARQYSIRFDRSEPRERIETSIALAEPFVVLAPLAGEMVSRSTSIDVAWDPPRAEQELRIALEELVDGTVCLQTPDTAYKESVGVPIADSGAWSIAAGTIVAAAGTSCDAKLVLRRFTAGDYPSSLRPGGFVEGQVQRAVAFISAP